MENNVIKEDITIKENVNDKITSNAINSYCIEDDSYICKCPMNNLRNLDSDKKDLLLSPSLSNNVNELKKTIQEELNATNNIKENVNTIASDRSSKSNSNFNYNTNLSNTNNNNNYPDSLSNYLDFSKENKECVIIGGGAIGLYTGIQLRQKGFYGKITIYEKYKEYFSSRTVKLSEFETDISTGNLIINEFCKKNPVECDISEFEKLLLELGTTCFRFNMRYYNIDSLDALYEVHKDNIKNTFFIHCDGSDSITRGLLFKENCIVSKHLYYNIQISYSVITNNKQNRIACVSDYHNYKIEKYFSDRCNFIEHNVSSKFNKLTVRFFIDGEYYNSIKKYTANNPCLINDLLSDNELKTLGITDMILFYIKFRSYYTKETIIPNSFKLFSLELNCYRAKEFGVSKQVKYEESSEDISVNHYLLGESAMGVPFYRNMRNGSYASNCLTDLICKNYKPNKEIYSVNLNYTNNFNSDVNKSIFDNKFLNNRKDSKNSKNSKNSNKNNNINDNELQENFEFYPNTQKAISDYSLVMEKLTEEEFLKARNFIKPKTVKDTLIKASAYIPWEINKFNDKMINDINNIDLKI